MQLSVTSSRRSTVLFDRDTSILVVGLSLFLVVLVLLVFRNRPSTPKPLGAPTEEFSAQRAQRILKELLGDGVPHPIGSPAHEAVFNRAAGAFRRLGYKPEVQSGFFCDRGYCAELKNLFARLPGENPDSILLVAHYDSVAAGPGASDDGTGVAALLEVARALEQGPNLRHSVLFLMDDGEEAGLLGARFFLSESSIANSVEGLVNLDTRGTSGPSLMFETGGANDASISLYARSVKRPNTNSIYYTAYKMLPNSTDFSVFKEKGYQGFNLAFIGDPAQYHTQADNLSNVSLGTLQDTGNNALSLVRSLGDTDPASFPKGEAVFFDFLSLWTIHWPATWSAGIAFLAALLVLVVVIGCARRDLISAPRLAWGMACWPSITIGSALVGFAIFSLLRKVGALPVQWVAHSLPALALSWASSFAIVSLLSVLFGARSGFWELWAGTWLWWTLIALLLSNFVPGTSYFFLVPSMVAGAMAVFHLTPCRPMLRQAASAIIPMLATTLVGLSTIWLFYDGFGRDYLGPNTVLAAIILTPFAPLIGSVKCRWRWTISWLSVLVLMIALVAACLVPPYSERTPQGVNVNYSYDADTSEGKWLLDTESGAAPTRMQQSAKFSDQLIRPFPWSTGLFLAADALNLHLSAPTVKLVELSPRQGAASYRILVRSLRNAPVTTLLFPSALGVKSVSVRSANGASSNAELSAYSSGWSQLTCLTMPPEGLELTFSASSGAPVDIYAIDRSFGLPPEGAAFQNARRPTETPFQDGDTTVVAHKARLSQTNP
jgi:hypothetical protein